jgi:hypothetical protein
MLSMVVKRVALREVLIEGGIAALIEGGIIALIDVGVIALVEVTGAADGRREVKSPVKLARRKTMGWIVLSVDTLGGSVLV